jgi:hypothetical protein
MPTLFATRHPIVPHNELHGKELDPAAIARHRRRVRLARFIAFETIAVTVLVASIVAGISARFAAESLTPIFRVLPVMAASVAAILPILFFGDPKRRGR